MTTSRRRLRNLLSLSCLALASLVGAAPADAANPACPGALTCPWNSVTAFAPAGDTLRDATDVAVDPADGDVYVVEREYNRVVRYVGGNAATREVWGARGGTGLEGDGPGEFSMPEGVAVDGDGNVWVAEINGNRVQKLDEDGDPLLILGATQGAADGQLMFPNDVAVDASGNVYVADSGNNRIQKFDGDGNWEWTTGASGDGDGEFAWAEPLGIATDGTSVWATDGDRIQKFDAATGAFQSSDDGGGIFSSVSSVDAVGGDLYAIDGGGKVHKLSGGTWSTHTLTGNASLTGIDVANGHVFLSNASNPHVDRLTTAFADHAQLFAPPAGSVFRATGVAVDGTGDVWVAEGEWLENYHRLHRYSAAGTHEQSFGANGADGSHGAALGEFSGPRDIAVEGSNVYVLDSDNDRIQVYDGVSWSALPSAGFDTAFGIALDPTSDEVYVVDSIYGASKLWTFDGVSWTSEPLPNQADGDFAQDVAVDGSDLYVAIGSFDNSRILKRDGTTDTWTTVVTHGSGDGQVDYPRSLTVANGHLLVADTGNGRVQKLTTAGAFVAQWGGDAYPAICEGDLADPHGIAASVDGNQVYVADRLNGVSKFSLDGTVAIPACDTTAPTGLGIDVPAADATNVSQMPTFSGHKGNGTGDSDTVTLRVWKRVGSTGAMTLLRTLGTTNDADTWSAPWTGDALADGVYWAQASQSDATGNARHSYDGFTNWGMRRFTVGDPAPVVTPTVTMSSTSQATKDTTPNLTGAASDNGGDDTTVIVEIYAGSSISGSPVRTFHAIRNATSWSLSDTHYANHGGALPEGTYTARASQSNAAASPDTGHSPARTFTVDTTAPAIQLGNPADHSKTTSKRPSITGTAGNRTGLSPDENLTFELNRSTSSGWVHVRSWSYAKPTSGTSFSTQVPFDLTPGTYHLRAYQSDRAGNHASQGTNSSRLFTVEQPASPPKLTVSSPGHLSATSQRQPTISGTSDTAGQVKVELHRWTGSTWAFYANYYTYASGGYWSVRPSSALPDGTYSPIVYQTNTFGQTSHAGGGWWSVDTVPPAKPRITSPANNTKTGTQTPTFSGTADAQAGTNKVYLQFQGYQNGKWVVLKTETLTLSGSNWSFRPTQYKFGEGYFAAFAYQYDAAGNFVSSDASTFQIDLNAKAPDNPGTSNNVCQKKLDWGPFHVEGSCLKREGLTWVSTASLTFNGLRLQPEGGNAKVILDPFNLRIAAQGKVKVVLGPAHFCLEDPTKIISDTCFYSYKAGPFVLYEGAFDWSWQGKVQLPDQPRFGLPTGRAANLPQLPGLGSFNLPNLSIPGWGPVALPDFSRIKGPEIGKLSLPSLNAPQVTLPEKYFGNFKFDLPRLSIGTSGGGNLLGFPFEGRVGLRFADQGIYVDAGLKLPSILGGVTGDAELFVGNAGNFAAKNLNFHASSFPMGPIGFRDLNISYSAANQLWQGSSWIDLPIPPTGLAVKAGAGFKNGQLVNAEAGFNQNFAIGTSGLFLYGGSIYFKTVPSRQVGGEINLGLGPDVKGVSAVRVDSGFKYQFSQPGWQSYFRIDGSVKVVNIPLASGWIEIYEGGDVDFGGRIGKNFGGGFLVEATVDGWIQRDRKFNVAGTGKVHLGDWIKLNGNVNVSHIGVGGCATADGWFGKKTFGATYKWSGALTTMWDNCSVAAVTAKKSTARVAGATQTVTVPGGQDAYVMGFKGQGGAPEITLVGPKGERITTTGKSGLVDQRFLVIHVSEQNTTQVAIARPGAGRWTVEVEDGSVPLEQVLTAETLDDPKVEAKVRGKGDDRVLSYDVDAAPGDRVAFVEVGPGGAQSPLGEVGEGSGKLRFTPIAGPAGRRTVKAVVMNDGVARFTVDRAATFRASRPAIPAPPRKVRAKRKKGKQSDALVVRWAKVPGATRYRVRAIVSGRRKVIDTRKTRVKIPGLFARSKGTAAVQAMNALGQTGKARKAVAKPPKPKHPQKKTKKKKKKR